MKIGVFDSGVGGQSMASAIKKSLPDHEIVVYEDKEHLPYGSRSPREILGFVTSIFEKMIGEGCEVIVVACNTVTTTLIGDLRERFNIPLIAVEPMIKPAASLTKSKAIAVCATPTTIASQRYRQLKNEYANDIKVLEPDCSDWAYMIESRQIDHEKIARRIKGVLVDGADVIVLACTHYHWIEDDIKKLVANKAIVIQPEEAIIRQLKRVIEQLPELFAAVLIVREHVKTGASSR
jgi:glutamate racemase